MYELEERWNKKKNKLSVCKDPSSLQLFQMKISKAWKKKLYTYALYVVRLLNNISLTSLCFHRQTFYEEKFRSQNKLDSF